MGFKGFLNGFYDIENQLIDYLYKKADAYFSQEKQAKDNIKSVGQFEQRRAYIRQHFIDAIGGLDIERTPLEPICTGTIDREGYQIKKIIFQSMPNVYVTSNLYIPTETKGKMPAVIFSCGHMETSKAAINYQKVCIDLVNNGFVVLAVDPLGQGERRQYYEKEAGRSLIGWGVVEHSYAQLQCDLIGSAIARYFIWDIIRAIDYLCTLPEVDEQNIGMTGNSGGGTQTAYMMLVDDRLKAAVPCTYIASRESFLKSGQSHDGEQNIFGAISKGLNYDDFITCFAPKPALIGAVDSDFFPIEGVLQTYERAKHVYGLYNCLDNVSLFVDKGMHRFSDGLRQAAVNWFIKHLKGQEGDFITDPGMKTENPLILRCTDSGQVVKEFGDARTVYDLNVEYMEKHRYEVDRDILSLRNKVKKVLNMPTCKGPIYPRVISNDLNEYTGLRYSDLFFFSEPDVAIAGTYIGHLREDKGECTILLMDEATKRVYLESDLINMLLQSGDVFILDPRGTGAVHNREVNPRQPFHTDIYTTEFKLNYDAIMMETSLCALRVFDVLRTVDLIEQKRPTMKVNIAGKGSSALYALLASFMDDRVKSVYLEDMINSFEDIVRTKYYDYKVDLEIYGVLKKFDIPQLLEIIRNDKNVTLINRH